MDMDSRDSIKERVKKLLKSMVTTISPEITARVLFFSAFRRRLDLNHPVTLDEKLCWLKINDYGNNPIYSRCADKYRVRAYVEEKGLGFLLNECYGAYDSVQDIPWDSLPDSFVLKCNHGCGYNVLCPDKARVDKRKVFRLLDGWMREDYWRLNAELNYRGIPKKIICEAYLESEDQHAIDDYKFYCFHGKPYCVMVCRERETEHTKFYFFYQNWNLLRINPDSIAAAEGFTLEKPKMLDDMFRYAQILSEDFKFVRVDFYAVKDRVIFGELTFTPASAMDKQRLPRTDKLLGDMLHLDFEKKKEPFQGVKR